MHSNAPTSSRSWVIYQLVELVNGNNAYTDWENSLGTKLTQWVVSRERRDRYTLTQGVEVGIGR